MPLKQKVVDRLFDTVWAICASKYVSQYIIGYTARAGAMRYAQYARNDWHHLVTLADKLTRKDAQDLEEHLQTLCWKNRRHPTYRKYEPRRRDRGKYYRSHGGTEQYDSEAPIHSVYMVWRE